MEEDPYAIVEAMTIEGFATGSARGFLYLRAEYPLSAARMAHALATARAAGYLGDDILGSGFSFDIEIRRGAGAYICGEETALFNSIEGRRGEPRNKPPFPVEVGPLRQADGGQQHRDARQRPGDRRRRRGRLRGDRHARGARARSSSASPAPSSGPASTRSTSGRRSASCWPSPAGWPADGRCRRSCSAARPASSSGPTPSTCPLTFEGTRAAGRDARLGRRDGLRRDAPTSPARSSGSPPSSATSRAGSASPAGSGPCARRSCWRASRPGGRGGRSADELALLADLGRGMRDASICGLGQTASTAIESALRAGLVDFGAGGPAPPREARVSAEIERIFYEPPARPSRIPEPPPAVAAARGRDHPRRAARRRAGRLHDPRRLPRRGDRRPDPLLPREPHPGQRLPRLRRRGDREPGPRARPARAGSRPGWRSRPARSGSGTAGSSSWSCWARRSTSRRAQHLHASSLDLADHQGIEHAWTWPLTRSVTAGALPR